MRRDVLGALSFELTWQERDIHCVDAEDEGQLSSPYIGTLGVVAAWRHHHEDTSLNQMKLRASVEIRRRHDLSPEQNPCLAFLATIWAQELPPFIYMVVEQARDDSAVVIDQ